MIYNIIAIISTLGILSWMVTDYFGGMVIYLFSYSQVIIPIVILYVFSLSNTILLTINKGIKQNKVKVIFHGIVLFSIILTKIVQSEILKSERIITAILKDDICYYTLILRENGKCENEITGIFGFHLVTYGNFKLNEDTIIFTKNPYENNLIPDSLLINKKEKAIFINKEIDGTFCKKKKWLNYFEIQ